MGADSDAFYIEASSGQIKTKDPLDHESPADSGGNNVYDVTVQVTDGKDAGGNADTSVDDSVAVTITVTNVNEPPEFGDASNSLVVAENTVANTDIGGPVQATDAESDTLTYSLVEADASSFDIDSSSGQIKTKSPLDHDSPGDSDGDNVYELTVQVSDGKDAGGNADTSVDDSIAVTITVTNINEPPEFVSSAVELEVKENSLPKTNVGDPVAATDPESATLTYSLSGADSDAFYIEASSGQIKTKDPLDHESQPIYMLTVTATDPGDLAAASR